MATSVDCMKTEDYIAHMIDVIKPFLVKHVKCLHLLPFLPFMRGHAGKILKLERSGDLAGASELFLKCLQECDSEPGRYAAFRDALHEADYDHVASVLEGGDMEENHQEHCKLIEIFTSSIIDKMDPIEMVRLLRQHDLLTDSDENEIRNIHREHSRYDAALYLLDCVHRRKLGWYDKFMSTMLEIYPELVQLVDPHFKEKKERQNSSKKSEETFTESIEELTLSENDLSNAESTGDADRASHYHPESKLSNQEAETAQTITLNNQSRGRLDNMTNHNQFPLKLLESPENTRVVMCNATNCVHCALFNNKCAYLQGQIVQMQTELSELKQMFSKFLQAQNYK